LGPAASSYFSIFHELLADHFRSLISAGDGEAAREVSVQNIKNACCQSLATYLFAQMMLADLARGGDAGGVTPGGFGFDGLYGGGGGDGAGAGVDGVGGSQSRSLAIRVSQELEAAAAATHGAATVHKIAPLLAASDADATAMAAAGELLLSAADQRRRQGAGAGPGLPQGILRKLHNMYLGDGGPDGGDAGMGMGGMGGGLGGGLGGGGWGSTASLGMGGGSNTSLAGMDMPPGMGMGGMGMGMGMGMDGDGERPSPAPLRHPELLKSLFDEAFLWGGGAGAAPGRADARTACLDLLVLATTAGPDEHDAARQTLEATLETLENAARGVAPGVEFTELIRSPSAAAGAVAWVRSAMGSSEHYRQVHAGASNAIYLGMLSAVAQAQARLRESVLDVVTATLTAMGKGSNEELHHDTLDIAVELVELGLVLPTLEAAAGSWRQHIDPSHLRYFVGEVLEVAGAPYGGAFASAALRLLELANAPPPTRRVGTPGCRGMTAATDDFVQQCREQRRKETLLPPLGKEEAATLERLA
jgi:hypothetical protein